MTSINRPTATGLPEDEEILDLTDGENPLKFLANTRLAKALIRGINDRDRLEGWRLAEQRYVERTRDRRAILDALDEREAELTGEPVATETADPEPVESEPAEPTNSEESEPEFESEPTDPTPSIHPDARLDAGDALVVDRGAKTEVITAATDIAAKPYVSRSYDEDGHFWTGGELTELEFAKRLDRAEKTSIDDLERETDIEIDTEAGPNRGVA